MLPAGDKDEVEQAGDQDEVELFNLILGTNRRHRQFIIPQAVNTVYCF